MSLPTSTDPSTYWAWSTKWTVSPDGGPDGWSFATTWTAPPEDWVTDLDRFPTIPTSGIAARRMWIRVMKKITSEESLHAEPEHPEPTITRKSWRPSRSNSISSRLLGLVIGVPSRPSSEPAGPEITDESEVDETFSTRAQSLNTATPASSLYETQMDALPDQLASSPQTAQGHRHTTSSTSNRSQRVSSVLLPASPVLRRHGMNQSGGSGNDGDGRPGPQRATWEPDEAVEMCRVCNRRFTTFLRRHHCRYSISNIQADEDIVDVSCVIDVPLRDI